MRAFAAARGLSSLVRWAVLPGFAAMVCLATCAVGVGHADSSELEYRGASLAAPANETVLPSSTGITLAWSLPPSVAATSLAITADPSFFSGFTGSGAPTRPGVMIVPLQSQQISYSPSPSLPRGVTLYWAVSSACSECAFGPASYYSQPFAFGVANPASSHTARSYIKRVIEGLGDAETGVEVRLLVKCASPTHGAIRCSFTTPGLDGVAVLSTASGPFTKFDITATQVEGCGVAEKCSHSRHWRGTEAQVCNSEGLALVPIGSNAGLFCDKAELPPYQ